MTNTKYVINHEHYRNKDKQDYFSEINKIRLIEEKRTGDLSNGLSSLEYSVLCYFELAPKFTVFNVAFKVLDKNI